MESPIITIICIKHLAYYLASNWGTMPPSHCTVIHGLGELVGDCRWLFTIHASSYSQLQHFLYNYVYYCLSQCVYLTALPPIKRLICPQIQKFLLLCCYIRTVIVITAFSVSELEHLCTLLDAGRPRGKNLKNMGFLYLYSVPRRL